MNAEGHPLFAQAGPTGEVQLSSGSAPTPYMVFDGQGLLIVGHCEAAAIAESFAGQDVFPVLTTGGQAVLILFVCDFRSASHGPHLEFHVTCLAAPTPGEVIPDTAAAALAALARRRDWGVLSLHLWNDTAPVVAYNTEYLGLQARACTGQITLHSDRMAFDFADAGGGALVKGQVRLKKRSDSRLMGQVISALGWRGMWDAVRRKPALAHVINRKSAPLPRNGRALTRTAPDKMIVTAFDATQDRLTFEDPALAALGFRPLVLEHLWPFRFVYHHPDES